MGTLVSPGVSVSVINESFFIPVSAPTVPLFFVATREQKTGTDNVTPAAGTLESSVVRTITSLSQSLATYGVPFFRNDTSGNEFHGDARNEYGLFALNQFLAVGNRAFVTRANIDLNDTPVTFISLGTPVLTPGSLSFNGIGNGTMATVSATSNQVRPQVVTVTITNAATLMMGATFTVTGSVDGYIGAGVTGTPFVSTSVGFTITAGSTAFAVGDKFNFALSYTWSPQVGVVGNGTVTSLVPDTLAVDEVFTISFTSPTAFAVTGTVSGPAGTGVVGSPFDNNRINFTVVAGTTPFAVGDEFDVTVSTVTISNPLGSNDAQRRLAIVTALQAEINSNTEVRSPLYEFNLILCPGYPEVVDELLALSLAVREEAMVIADTPADKTADQVAQWALTSERFTSINAAYYYPWCLASNLDGRNVLAAPSGTALQVIGYSDNAGYVWTPPAGVSRGQIVGVSKVGYYSGTPGTATTFIEANLNDGQRDNLYEYDKNINPIVFFPGRGLLMWGQKTSAPAASSLDRINVARLVMYLRRAMRKGALPFVFEPNDKITRDNLKTAADGILNDILIKRGLVDYASICDDSNNTPDRVQRNELWIDVAIKPTIAAEYLYIPIRVVNQAAEI
jgi:Phage tail sheath C-terminal domain